MFNLHKTSLLWAAICKYTELVVIWWPVFISLAILQCIHARTRAHRNCGFLSKVNWCICVHPASLSPLRSFDPHDEVALSLSCLFSELKKLTFCPVKNSFLNIRPFVNKNFYMNKFWGTFCPCAGYILFFFFSISLNTIFGFLWQC